MNVLRTIGWALLGAGVASVAGIASPTGVDEPPRSGLIVHEWGTFTAVADSSGVPLEWRPLNAPDDLPDFVHGPHGTRGEERRGLGTKLRRSATVRMETPVIYFYTDRPMDVSVTVDFSAGWITEWYPTAEERERGLSWPRVSLDPAAKEAFPSEPRPSHYFPARDTEAVPLRIGEEREKFLFYRGLGTFDLPFSARLEGPMLSLRARAGTGLGPVVVFERRAGRSGVRVVPRLEEEAAILRPELGDDPRAVERVLIEALVEHGLFRPEAVAMLRTWEESWFGEGLRVFAIVPRTETDTLLPLTIVPAPAALERVLVARLEILTAEFEAEVRAAIARAAGQEQVETCRAELVKLGRFAEPVAVKAIAELADPALRSRLLAALLAD